ncbi:MAG: serine hydrolase, partial [Acidobacteriota bacterium]
SRKSRWRPGTRMSYCNSGPPIAAYVVEKITGQTFEDYVQKNLFDPLQMSTASYFLTPQVEQKLTKLYHDDGTTTYPYWHISMRPSGSMNASAREMGNYVQMYLNRGSFNGQQIVQPASLERMEKPASTYAARAGMTTGYGLSNYTTPYKSFLFHGHNGGVEGGLTEMSYLPEHGIGFVMMMNSGNGGAYTQINDLIRSYLIRDLPKPSLPPALNISPELAAKYDGWYEPISPRTEILRFMERILGMARARVNESKFELQSLGRTREYVPVSNRLLREKNTPVATVALIPEAEKGIVVQTSSSTFKRISTPLAILQIVLPVLVLALMLSSVLFALIWIPRKLFGKLRDVPHLRVRVLPLIAALSLAGFVFLMLYGTNNILLLGRITWLSVTIFTLTILFALASVWGLIAALRTHRNIKRSVAIHSLLVSIANTMATIYLAYWGIIGLRTWG